MNWKKAPIIAIDVVLAVYLLLAITAFNKPDEEASLCTEVPITLEKDDVEGFLTEKDVVNILKRGNLYPVGKPMKQVKARQIEELLQGNELVEKADVYKTASGHVCINISQRIPVVRIMNANTGEDYCIDSNGEVMPKGGYTCNLLIVTGHISKTYAKKSLASLASIINADMFWRNQVEQLNVLNDGSVEIVPRVGEHIAYLGQPTGVANKLERLRKFYRYGLNQAGWNKYSRVSVEFDNQIICKRRHHK